MRKATTEFYKIRLEYYNNNVLLSKYIIFQTQKQMDKLKKTY